MNDLIQKLTREDVEIFEDAVKLAVNRAPINVDFSYVGIFGSAADMSAKEYKDIDFVTIPTVDRIKPMPGDAILANMFLLYAVNDRMQQNGRYLAVANNWSDQEDTYALVASNVRNKGKIIPIHNFVFLDEKNTLAIPEKYFAKNALRTEKTMYGVPRLLFYKTIISDEKLALYQLMFKSNLVCQVNLPEDFAYRKLKSKLEYFSRRYDNGLTVAEVEASKNLNEARNLLVKSLRYMDTK